ncbi:MAG: hypothetical protein GXY61_13665 [Lentisphaerae bacterium]|nr:hypothetical protein [Lentisphaerota bacterium]
MALKKCKDCGGKVSKRAKKCPHCGAPVKKKSGCLGVFILLVLVIVIGAIVAPAPESDGTDTTSTEQTAPSSQKKQKISPVPTAPAEPITPDWEAREAELIALYLPDFKAPEVGSEITLTLNNGSTQQGTISQITEDEIQLIREGFTFGFTESELSPESGAECFATVYATYRALQKISEEKAVIAAKELEEQRKLEARRLAEEEQRKAVEAEQLAAERMERIEKGFSAWDGSHIELTKVIKNAMYNPESYKHVKTTFSDLGEHLLVFTTYRGSNAFGGIIPNTITAKCDLDGNVLEIIEQ